MFGDITKSFGRGFLIGNLAPAILFVSTNTILIALGFLMLPNLVGWKDLGIQYLDHKIVILVVAATFIAILLQQFGTTLVQLYEGYLGRSWFSPLKRMSLSQERLYAKRVKDIEQAKKRKEDTSLMEYELSRNFAHGGAILPTKLGNIIRAFEYYARKVYNIDAITGWSRLTAVIPSPYKEEIEKAQVDFSFALNLSFLFTIIGAECLIFPGRLGSLIISVCCFILAYVLYRTSCSNAQWWGEYVRSAFDLYRFDLLVQMGIALPSQPITLKQEKEIWGHLQEQTYFVADPGDADFTLFPDGLKFLPKSVQSRQGKNSTEENCE